MQEMIRLDRLPGIYPPCYGRAMQNHSYQCRALLEVTHRFSAIAAEVVAHCRSSCRRMLDRYTKVIVKKKHQIIVGVERLKWIVRTLSTCNARFQHFLNVKN